MFSYRLPILALAISIFVAACGGTNTNHRYGRFVVY